MIKQISNKDLKFQELKKLLKTQEEGIVATDDISVIALALKYDIKIIDLFITSDIEYHKDTKELIDKIVNKAQNSYYISSKLSASIKRKENSASVFAIIELKKYDLDYFKNLDFIVVCDSLEIPGNIGTIFRTCDSAKVDGLILCNPVTKQFNPNIVSSSRGCNLIVPTLSLSYQDTLNLLQEAGYNIYLGEPELGKNYQEYDYKGKTAIVIGNERFGINPDWYNHNHLKVFIPMLGSNSSLNVSVAGSILIYEARMKKGC